MGVVVSCPRCGGPVRTPDLMNSDWRCDSDGAVLPLHVAQHIGQEIVESVRAKVRSHPASGGPMPMWCPWPPLPGWTVTGVAWVGDERSGVRATVVACSGPAPLHRGPADIVLVAEEPGVGLGTRFAGIPGPDPGPYLESELESTAAHAKVKADGWPTALWAVKSAGYLLAENVVLHDLVDSVPAEMVYGAPSPYLHGAA